MYSSYYTNGDAMNVGTLNNLGYVSIAPNATLNLTNQLGGITDVVQGSTFLVEGTVNDVLGGANGFANLQSIEGTLYVDNAQTTTMTPGNGTLAISNTGTLDVSHSAYDAYNYYSPTIVNVSGSVDNYGHVSTSGQDYFYSYNYTGNTPYTASVMPLGSLVRASVLLGPT